jgi:hypothetical protein
VQAILMHPAFYKGPGMIKPPIVFTAGLLRAQNAGITTDSWAWLSEQTGQRLFYPPNVAGWDDAAWLDTGRFRGRWNIAREATQDVLLDPGDKKDALNWDPEETPEQAYKNVMNFWGNPIINGPSRAVLMDFARKSGKQADSAKWKKKPYRVMRQNAMRTLVAMSPDHQTS